MEKFIITWSCGFGDSYETVEAENKDDAVTIAYEYALEEVQTIMDYSAEEWTEELEIEYEID